MAQYKTGKVAVRIGNGNPDSRIFGNSTVDWSGLAAADRFIRLGDNVSYEIASLTDKAVSASGKWEMDLTANYAGTASVAAQGTLTLPDNPTDGDTFTLGSKTYTMQDTLTDVDGNIKIAATTAGTQSNIEEAINLTGTPGTDYAASMTINPDVSAAAFSGNDSVMTAKEGGADGNSLVSTETFTSANNVFDATTLGTTTLGTDENYTVHQDFTPNYNLPVPNPGDVELVPLLKRALNQIDDELNSIALGEVASVKEDVVAIGNGALSIAVTFPGGAFSTAPTVVQGVIQNHTDGANAQIMTANVDKDSITVSGCTFHFNAPTDSLNYELVYRAYE